MADFSTNDALRIAKVVRIVESSRPAQASIPAAVDGFFPVRLLRNLTNAHGVFAVVLKAAESLPYTLQPGTMKVLVFPWMIPVDKMIPKDSQVWAFAHDDHLYVAIDSNTCLSAFDPDTDDPSPYDDVQEEADDTDVEGEDTDTEATGDE